MSHRTGDTVVICATAPEPCELCGTVAELRPYGADGEKICFDCASKDPATTERRMAQVLFGDRFDA